MSTMQRSSEYVLSLMQAPFVEAVATERAYQDQKWGGEPNDRGHNWPEWMLLLDRELGEVADAIADVHWSGGGIVNLRFELIQVAALCAAMIEVIDERRKGLR